MAGSDAGHAFPALALAKAFVDAGDEAIVYTGTRWFDEARRSGARVAELPGLAALPGEDDDDAGAKLTERAARMATALAPVLAADGVDLVVSDVITRAGGWAAELIGVPWIELAPHPLYEQSRGLPPIGAGLEPGTGVRGRLRDLTLRALSAPAHAQGRRRTAHARRSIQLSPAPEPAATFVATLPGLEVHRPDWPARTHLIGPLLHEPTDESFAPPPGAGPLVVVAPSTASTGEADLGAAALEALAGLEDDLHVRTVYSALTAPAEARREPVALVSGTGRQDEVLRAADVAVCGGGHGMLAKALLAGTPVVVVPGGGDQWELASRVLRAGAGLIVRPAEPGAVADAVRRVLADETFAANAARIGATASRTVDPVTVARRVLREDAARRRSEEVVADAAH